jgi:hypothetical protein
MVIQPQGRVNDHMKRERERERRGCGRRGSERKARE